MKHYTGQLYQTASIGSGLNAIVTNDTSRIDFKAYTYQSRPKIQGTKPIEAPITTEQKQSTETRLQDALKTAREMDAKKPLSAAPQTIRL